jgi:hypothetical protein
MSYALYIVQNPTCITSRVGCKVLVDASLGHDTGMRGRSESLVKMPASKHIHKLGQSMPFLDTD